jgi:transcriptional regulatory protein RtcR
MNKAPSKPLVVIGIAGTRLDAGHRQNRWQRWRPTVALCQHDELVVERLELIHSPHDRSLVKQLAEDIAAVSPETTVVPHVLDVADPWDFEQVFAALHAFARQYPFRPEDEDYLIHIATGTHVQQICLFLLAESRHLPGRLIQTSPPASSQPKPRSAEGTYRIIDLDLSQYDALAQRFADERRDDLTFLKSGIATRNPAFNRLMERIERVAIASRAPLLITGPTGAGKSQLAKRIYELKRRRRQVEGALVEVNCATLRGDQAMSALFGHARGAFTGASAARAGLLRSADRGLLFLDEIGELGLDEQAMLLRAIEERRFLPVGSDAEVTSDFQLIAGTNRNLQQAVAAGRFREDLLARINLWTFTLPGLAERREDIEPNLDFELDRFSQQAGRRITWNREARSKFLAFAESASASWRGNFRDLNAAVTRLGTLAVAGRVTEADVREEIERLRDSWSTPPGGNQESIDADDSSTTTQMAGGRLAMELIGDQQWQQLDLFDRLQLSAVLKICSQARSLSDAGRMLFAVSRLAKTQPNDADRLRKFLARFQLAWDPQQAAVKSLRAAEN